MKKYLVVLKNKRNGELNSNLLHSHIRYLKKLSEEGYLKLCGPFADNEGAFMVFHCERKEEVESIVK